MSDGIGRELLFFLQAAVTGVFLLVLYDMLRILRRIVRHNRVAVSAEDFMYWLSCSLLVFYVLLRENNGSIRWFFIVGILCGMLLYNLTISRYVVVVFSFCIKKILYVVVKIAGVLIKPFKIVSKRLVVVAKKRAKFVKLIVKNIKKILKNAGKAVKIGIVKK